MSTISHCYVLVFWLQSHILPCNFDRAPLPAGHKVACRACVRIRDVLPCRTFICRTQPKHMLWFVELAYHACMPRYSHPTCKHSSAVIELWTWLNQLQWNMYKHSSSVLGVSTILGDRTVKAASSDGPTQVADWGDDGESNTSPILNQSRFEN